MTYCSRCGNLLKDEDLYCPKCGNQVIQAQAPQTYVRRHRHHHTMAPLTIALIVVAVVVVFGMALPAVLVPPLAGVAVGSGHAVTTVENNTGFTSVAISSGFRFTITQSSSYSVTVTTDDNIVGHLQATQSGNALSIGLTPWMGVQSTSLSVQITMPDITQLDISGGASGTVSGFNSSHGFTIDASYGSSATITGSASSLSVDASYGSRVDLSGFHVTNAQVNLSWGSWATVNLDGRLDANVSWGSQLFYIGNPTMGSINSTGGSNISRR